MTATSPKSSDVRQWARSKGLEVGERGRLSPDVLAAYSAAHGGPAVKAAAKKAPAKKAPAKKSAAKKAPAKKVAAKKAGTRAGAAQAPARKPFAARPTNGPTSAPAVRSTETPAESSKPTFRTGEAITGPPAVTMDSERVVALEEQIAKLASRLERLESARAGAPKRGLFSRK